MRVVSNTSPLSSLARIGRLNLLCKQCSQLLVPEAVVKELRDPASPPALKTVDQALQEGWIIPAQVRDRRLVRLLTSELDLGEAEAIALAMETSAGLILIDELEGRRTARRLGLRVTGVLGVLLRAKKAGQIRSLRREVEALRKQAHFFISPRVEGDVLRAAGE